MTPVVFGPLVFGSLGISRLWSCFQVPTSNPSPSTKSQPYFLSQSFVSRIYRFSLQYLWFFLLDFIIYNTISVVVLVLLISYLTFTNFPKYPFYNITNKFLLRPFSCVIFVKLCNIKYWPLFLLVGFVLWTKVSSLF